MKRNRRMPAEWENPSEILIAFPHEHSDWNYILEEAEQQFFKIIKTLTSNGVNVILLCNDYERKRALFFDIDKRYLEIISTIPYNDTWIRDYGAMTVEEEGDLRELDFGFNGWGLKFAADKDNLVNLNLHIRNLRPAKRYHNDRDYILEGGSVETDGNGTLLTTTRCLCNPNRNGGKSKEEIEKILGERLGLNHFLWLDYGFLEGDDTDSHIDTLARLAPGNKILYISPPASIDDPHYEELKKMEEQLKTFRTPGGEPYELMRLPFPEAIYDEEGNRLPATYANYLVIGDKLFMPTYRQPMNDRMAIEVTGKAFPGHKIIGVESLTLLRQHGSLHCSTMQLYGGKKG